MKHVMIDIEAMDNKPTAAIASMAAAIFGQLSDNLKSLAAKGAMGAAL